MATSAHRLLLAGALAAASIAVVSAEVTAGRPAADDGVVSSWTPERIAAAQPRDLVVDARGLGYLRSSDGGLTPYGHTVAARLVQEPAAAPSSPTPMAPPARGDSDGPTVTGEAPADGATTGGTVTFSATVTDESGLKSVSFVVVYPDGRTQSFTPTASGEVWSTTLSGFSDGTWGWYVVAKDGASRGGNSTTTNTWAFTVDVDGGGDGGGTGGGTGGTGDIVTNAAWTAGGDIQLAAGRILFEMPQLRGKRIVGWNAYVCSGTTVTDGNTGASVVLTAAHCVYDDVAKVFARNVLFIPNQADTSGAGTDTDCRNDPIGCFVPSHGVVDANWTTRTFPDNVEWDYAYYVIPNETNRNLEVEVNELLIEFSSGTAGEVTHALGYSYSDDPSFMYCAEAMTTVSSVNWWLPNCGLSGGSSGGPWVQPMDEGAGTGPIISVNSWGYANEPGMAGPLLDGSAECVFAVANDEGVTASDQGVNGAGLGVVASGCRD